MTRSDSEHFDARESTGMVKDLQKGWENILCIEKTKAIQVDITKSRINI